MPGPIIIESKRLKSISLNDLYKSEFPSVELSRQPSKTTSGATCQIDLAIISGTITLIRPTPLANAPFITK